MTERSGHPPSTATLGIFALLAALAVTMLIGGGMRLDHDIGRVTAIAGAVAVGWIALSFLRRWTIAGVYGMLLVLAGIMIAAGVTGLGESWADLFIGLGLLAVIVVATAATISAQMSRFDRRGGGTALTAHTTHAAHGDVARLEARVERLAADALLTDRVKQVIHAEGERGALLEAINGSLHAGDFAAARRICDAMEEMLGNAVEAAQLRQQIDQVEHRQEHAHVDQAVAEFDRALAARNWSAAFQEAARVREMRPDEETRRHLEVRVQQAREEHKQHLLGVFYEAFRRDDVEKAMESLKELDRYLSTEDAEKISQDAHFIVEKHRNFVGTSFRMAVQDRRWAEASKIGTTIMSEYPNTKMAEEVRAMIDVLHTRATRAALSAANVD